MKDTKEIFDKLDRGEITNEQARQLVDNLFIDIDTWLSPIDSERQWQETYMEKIWPGYPNNSFRWQYLNGLIVMSCKYLKIKIKDEE